MDLNQEEQQRFKSGCLYELMKLIACILMGVIIIYVATVIVGQYGILILMAVGTWFLARWLSNKLYPDDPLKEFRDKLEKDK